MTMKTEIISVRRSSVWDALRRYRRRRPRRQTVGGVVSQVGFDQKLGVQLPLDLRFRDDQGRELRLAELFGRRPVILAPVYLSLSASL